ncbi:MFS transporter [Ensifer sp. ENS07]|jgi:predicted MFS family arabinose efflux permease|uniref:MFS transporter n=1 Tax=Ensifer adhaerens TaxID=106592 RepID=A0A9Q9D9E0_ENSAD|nr:MULTISPECIES: MFS transporter [Ensifer]KQX44089.1 MFS transporter [Ensifer sp. Root1298]KQX73203.1 MFS transporter [Ensifer sp. Root1312]KRC16097.1 MFS transporter [Ensifer sp. Root74]KRD70223.1 MFS transporter [Ensifer sp. Root954]MBD9593527.1 MFS transporter [Ensifer sp. ENS05]
MPNPPRDTLPPAFKRIGWSNLFAQFSEQMALAAAPLAAVLLLAAGPAETGWLQMAQTLPFLLLSIPAGLVADRASRRRLMVSSEMLRALSLVATLLLMLGGLLSLPLLAVMGFVGAIGTVCYNVAAPALVPAIVPRHQLADANRWLELARSLAYSGGPAIGGAIVAWTGASLAYVAATSLSLLSVVLLAGLGDQQQPTAPRRNLLQDLAEGARFLGGHALLRPILVTAIVFNTAWFVLQAVYVAYAIQTLGLTATGVGITLGIYGAGMMIGAFAAPAIARRIPFGLMIALGPLGGLTAAAVMLSTIWVPSGALAGLSFFLFGAGPVLWSIATLTLRQAVTPNAMLGRVSAFITTATFGARPIGAALGAIVATRFGVEACLAVAAVGFLIQFLVIIASGVPQLRALPEAA